MYKQRIQRLDELIQDNDLDAVVLLPGSNLKYLTGVSFHLMERPIMLFRTPGQTLLTVPELERAKAETTNLELRLFTYGEDLASRREAYAAATSALGKGIKRVGVEPFGMRFHEFSMLKELADEWDILPADEALGRLRLIKNEGEVELMRQAVTIAERALHETLPKIQAGMTEKELEAELILQLNQAGSDPALPFTPIVASGPNSALPHATPTDRKLQSGDLLILDWGARAGGYISDLTRTFAIEEIDPELETIHLIVQQANDAGRDAIRPGASCDSVDQATREVIHAAGYGEFFIHRTGHGIGLEPHEKPYIVADNMTKLETGMTFTVEPGIYLPGKGGVRIEDNVVVTETGGESMSLFDRAIKIVG